MAEAFSDKDPERGKARLRCPGRRNSETVKSMQEGAKLFAMGTFHAVRNPAHHSVGDGEPVAALRILLLSQCLVCVFCDPKERVMTIYHPHRTVLESSQLPH
jgi:hypothetical protein